MITINNLTFGYEDKIVLDNICLKIENGDYLAITGSNGVGKSTLLKCLLGINKVKNQEILVDDLPIQRIKNFSEFGYVPQARTQITDIPITAYEFLVKTCKNIQKIDEVLNSLEIDFKNDLLKNLSGGQKQRLYIAKALMKDAKYLILDEPTVGIDENAKTFFYNLIHDLNKKGITIIMINHNFEEIIHRVHKVYNLETKELIINNDCRYC